MCQQIWSQTQACWKNTQFAWEKTTFLAGYSRHAYIGTVELRHTYHILKTKHCTKAEQNDKMRKKVFMSDPAKLTPMCYLKPCWCHLSWTINHFQKLNILSHLSKDLKVTNTSLKVNMKLELTICTFWIHILGLVVKNLSVHVTPKKKKEMFVSVIIQ